LFFFFLNRIEHVKREITQIWSNNLFRSHKTHHFSLFNKMMFDLGQAKKRTNLVQFFFALSYFRRNIYAIYLMAYTWNKWYCWFFYHLLQWFPLIYLKWFLISMHVDKFKLNNFHDFTNTYLLFLLILWWNSDYK
jgi:hypothetical protein